MSLLDRQYRRTFNTLLNSADKLLGNSRMVSAPLRIHLELNDICNLKCPHCPREHPDAIINTGHIPIEVIRNMRPFFRQTSYVGMAGNGEPFLHPDIEEIINIIVEEGATPSIISNATLWKKLDIFDKVVDIGPMLLNVSFDGGTKETFEKWRKRANFEEVLENLRLMREAKKKKNAVFPIINFITCLMTDTIDEVEQVIDIAGMAGADVVSFQNMFPFNKMLEDQRVKDMDVCRRAIGKARERGKKYNIRVDWFPLSTDVSERGTEGGSIGSITSEDAEKNITNGSKKRTENEGKVRYYCDSIMNSMQVDVSGNIRYCCFWTDGAVGNLKTDDPLKVWNGPEFKKLREDLKNGIKPGPCTNCHNLVVHDTKKIVRASKAEIKDIWNQ